MEASSASSGVVVAAGALEGEGDALGLVGGVVTGTSVAATTGAVVWMAVGSAGTSEGASSSVTVKEVKTTAPASSDRMYQTRFPAAGADNFPTLPTESKVDTKVLLNVSISPIHQTATTHSRGSSIRVAFPDAFETKKLWNVGEHQFSIMD